MSKSQELHLEAMAKAEAAFLAKKNGDSANYLKLTEAALVKEKEAAWLLFLKMDAEPTRSVLFRSAAWLAFNCGKMREAEQLISAALVGNPPIEIIEELRSLYRTILASFEPVH